MKIVLVGLGKVGRNIVENLSSEGHELICIDNSADAVDIVTNQFDVMGVVGNGANIDVLRDANTKGSDCFIAATNYDEINIMCCLLAKKLGVKNCIARIRNPEYHKQIDFMQEEFGVNLAINPEGETASEIKKMIDFRSTLKVNSFANNVDIIEYHVKEGSEIANKNLKQIRKMFGVNVLFVAIKRGEDILIPNGDTTILEGDSINIMGERQEIVSFLSDMDGLEKKSKNILIIGASKTAYYLLNLLSKGNYKVKIIEHKMEKCSELSADFPNFEVINGDGSDTDFLDQNGIKEADALISLTNLDETNFVIAMYARDAGVKKVITKLNRESLEDAVNKLDRTIVISPKKITAGKVMAHIKGLSNPKGNQILGYTKLIDETVDAITFKATAKCKLINQKLKDIRVKDNFIIGCVLRDKNVIIPNGNTEIKENDQVIVITNEENIEDINEILR